MKSKSFLFIFSNSTWKNNKRFQDFLKLVATGTTTTRTRMRMMIMIHIHRRSSNGRHLSNGTWYRPFALPVPPLSPPCRGTPSGAPKGSSLSPCPCCVCLVSPPLFPTPLPSHAQFPWVLGKRSCQKEAKLNRPKQAHARWNLVTRFLYYDDRTETVASIPVDKSTGLLILRYFIHNIFCGKPMLRNDQYRV